MRKNRRWILAAALMVSMADLAARAEDSNSVGIGLSADYFSKYVWRGQNVTNSHVFQPVVSISKLGFTGSVWGNMDWTSANNHSGEFTEFDYSLDYSSVVPNLDILGFSVGAVHYEFPSTAFRPTTEVYGGLNLNVPLTPYIKLYRDVQSIRGDYVQFGIGHTIEKAATFSENCYCGLQLGTSFGYGDSKYNRGYFGVNEGGMNDWTVSAGLPICFGAWTVKPSLNYSTMLDNDIRTNTAKSDNLWFGVGISRGF